MAMLEIRFLSSIMTISNDRMTAAHNLFGVLSGGNKKVSAMIPLQPYIVVFVAFVLMFTTHIAAYYDIDIDPSCSKSSQSLCEDPSTGNSTTTNDSHSSKTFSMFLYAKEDDPNASYPVIEYWEENISTIGSSTQHKLPSFLLQQQSDTYNNHYIMVKYYKPYCEACKVSKSTYIKTASYLQLIFMEGESDAGLRSASSTTRNRINMFQSFAISCTAFPHLCESTIHMYPTIRMYDMNSGNTIELDYRRLHPYSVMERLGFDDAVIHTNIYELSNRILNQQPRQNEDATVGRKFNVDQLTDNYPMKVVVDEIDYIYNHMKQSDLEQDLHVTVDIMLREHTYVPKNINMTTSRSMRDPPLKIQSAQTLRIFLELLLRIVSPIKNTHLERFHSMIKELSNSFIYITNHAGYLPVILDEFRIQPKFVSKRKNGSSSSPYSKDCEPNRPNIIITANDDDNNSPNAQMENSDVETELITTAPYQCGLWKLLFHMIVGGGLANYNIVATSENDKIPDIDMITMVRDYATHIGFGVWSDHEIQILYNTTFYNETDTGRHKDEPSEMKLALWMGTIRNEIQRYRLIHDIEIVSQERVMGADLLSVQWPSRDDCPHCWRIDQPQQRRDKQRTYTSSGDTYQYDRPVFWNDEIVFKYIQLEYGTPPGTIDELVQLYMDVHPEEFESRNGDHRDEL